MERGVVVRNMPTKKLEEIIHKTKDTKKKKMKKNKRRQIFLFGYY